MDDFIELFDENDLKELNLEPIKKKEVIKIVKTLNNINTVTKIPRFIMDKIYIPPETSKQLVRMMLKT